MTGEGSAIMKIRGKEAGGHEDGRKEDQGQG